VGLASVNEVLEPAGPDADVPRSRTHSVGPRTSGSERAQRGHARRLATGGQDRPRGVRLLGAVQDDRKKRDYTGQFTTADRFPASSRAVEQAVVAPGMLKCLRQSRDRDAVFPVSWRGYTWAAGAGKPRVLTCFTNLRGAAWTA
jgi:hypothetical protein